MLRIHQSLLGLKFRRFPEIATIWRLMHAAFEASAGIAFGRFLLLRHRRKLLADGRPVKLGGRAFDVLMALIEARGAVVSKDTLMSRVWPDQIVEENNLSELPCQPRHFAFTSALGGGAKAKLIE